MSIETSPQPAIGVSARRQWLFWAVAILVFCGLLWLLADVLAPFVTGLVIAYLLDPVADWIERRGLPRWLAATLVLVSFLAALLVLVLALQPLVTAQVVEFAAAVPGYVDQLQQRVLPLLESAMARLSDEQVARLREAVGAYAGQAVSFMGDLAKGLARGGLGLIEVISFLIVTPVVAFYMLRDWDRMIARIDSWLPRDHADTLRDIAGRIDGRLAGFIRGQASVVVLLGLFYAVALTVAGLNFGFLIGLGAGLLSFIPYVGSIVGFVVAVGVALFQFDAIWMAALVAGIFFAGQALEGNVLTPKLVGDSIGLHAVWIIFALMAGGSLLGFLGLMLAVPVAAVISVMARFGLDQYLSSPLYYGGTPPDEGAEGAPGRGSDRTSGPGPDGLDDGG